MRYKDFENFVSITMLIKHIFNTTGGVRNNKKYSCNNAINQKLYEIKDNKNNNKQMEDLKYLENNNK